MWSEVNLSQSIQNEMDPSSMISFEEGVFQGCHWFSKKTTKPQISRQNSLCRLPQASGLPAFLCTHGEELGLYNLFSLLSSRQQETSVRRTESLEHTHPQDEECSEKLDTIVSVALPLSLFLSVDRYCFFDSQCRYLGKQLIFKNF